MRLKTPGILLTTMLMISALVFVSCGDDDDVDCSKLENQISDISDDYYDAVFNEDCDELDDLYDKLVDKYKDAKSCKEFKEALELLDMTYDEYMQELEDEHQEYVDTCGGV
jgi:hypothetical protein